MYANPDYVPSEWYAAIKQVPKGKVPRVLHPLLFKGQEMVRATKEQADQAIKWCAKFPEFSDQHGQATVLWFPDEYEED